MNAILLSLILAAPAGSDSAAGRSTLAQAMFERRSSHFERALELLDEAQAQLTTNRLLAEVHEQRALIYCATDRPQNAVQSFIRALTVDPSRADKAPTGDRTPVAADAFMCAKKLLETEQPSAAWKVPATDQPWSCPIATGSSAAPLNAVKRPGPDSDGRAADLIRTAAEERAESGGAGPPVPTYILGGVAAASLGTGIALGAVAADRATDAEPGDGKGLATAANVTFAIAGSAAAAALLWWILD